MSYVTLGDLDSWLSNQLPADQEIEAELAIESASAWIDLYCGRSFTASASEARTFRADGPYGLSLGMDLVSVSALKTDDNGDGTFETTWATSDYQMLVACDDFVPAGRPYRLIEAIGDRTFPTVIGRRKNLVQITGVWGWPAVPAAVKQACLIEAAGIHQRKQSVNGIAGTTDFGSVRVSSQIDPTAAQLLAPYRMSFGIA